MLLLESEYWILDGALDYPGRVTTASIDEAHYMLPEKVLQIGNERLREYYKGATP